MKNILILIFYLQIISTNAQFQINGNASQLDCKCYRLTPNTSNQVGSVWNNYKINLNQDFDFTFKVFLGCNNSSIWTGADGIAFGLQAISTNIGVAGGSMGFGGVSPSLGVFIDTYQNTVHNDMVNDHISINKNGDVNHNSLNNLGGPVDLGEVENCTYDTLRVVWQASSTTYDIYYNNNLVISYIGNIVDSIFGGDSLVYWGFTGSGGSAYNEQKFCVIDFADISIDSSNIVTVDEHCDKNDGSITGISYSGGLSPTSIYWNNTLITNIDTTNIGSGSYVFTVSDALGCSDSINFYINNIAAPNIDTSSLIIINESCNQEDASISGITITNGSSPFYYLWNGDTSLLDTFNLSSGNYQLIVYDQFSCTDTANFYINSILGPTIDSTLFTIYNEDCGQSNGYISGLVINNGTSPFNYFWNNSSANLDTSNLHQGFYNLMVIDSNGCIDSASFMIHDINYHIADFDYYPNVITSGELISFQDLSYDTTISWNWIFGDTFSETSQNPTHSYYNPGFYTICLISTNSYNCPDTICTEINIIPAEIIIPNIFTPNGDFINDYFSIEGINDYYEISIINRWGEIIYNQYPYKNNWDGRTLSGLEIPEGTYFYILTNFFNNEKYSGTLNIIR